MKVSATSSKRVRRGRPPGDAVQQVVGRLTTVEARSLGGSLLRAGLVGVASGCRGLLGLAAVALTTPTGERALPASLLGGRWVKRALGAAECGELVVDKLPATASRLAVSSFASRVAFGALAAAALAGRERRDAMWPAAAVGAMAAAGGTIGGARWRRAVQRRGRQDWPAAVVEDLVALTLAGVAGAGPRCVRVSR